MMSRTRGSRNTVGVAGNVDKKRLSQDRSSALEENVQAIKRWESAILRARSKYEQVADWIASTAGNGPEGEAAA